MMNQETNMNMNNMMNQNNMNNMLNPNNMNMMNENNMNNNMNNNMMNQNNMNMMMNGMNANMMEMMMNNMNQLQKMMMNMMNNANNNNKNINFNNLVNQNNNNNEVNNDLNDEQLTIVFQRNKRSDKIDFIIKIVCKYDDLVNDVLNRYCLKTCERRDDLLFLYNSVNLKQNITVQNAGIINMSRILVIDTKQLIGGNFNQFISAIKLTISIIEITNFNNTYFFNILKS